jgi:hypothetical protein
MSICGKKNLFMTYAAAVDFVISHGVRVGWYSISFLEKARTRVVLGPQDGKSRSPKAVEGLGISIPTSKGFHGISANVTCTDFLFHLNLQEMPL